MKTEPTNEASAATVVREKLYLCGLKAENNMTEKEIVKAQDNNIPGTIRIDALFEKIAILIERSRQFVANAVNVAEVKTRYEVGRYIYEDEQQGERASYGKQVLKKLSARLMS